MSDMTIPACVLQTLGGILLGLVVVWLLWVIVGAVVLWRWPR